jgi:hypothetical protein
VNASNAAARVLIRPVRATTWRDLAYLLLGGPASIVAFVVFVTGVSFGLGMLVTLVGVPILFATAYAFRGIGWLERRRAALVLGRASTTATDDRAVRACCSERRRSRSIRRRGRTPVG